MEELIDLSNNEINDYHEKLHIYWNKLKEGYDLKKWSFLELKEVHSKILKIFKTKKLKHIYINDLDGSVRNGK